MNADSFGLESLNENHSDFKEARDFLGEILKEFEKQTPSPTVFDSEDKRLVSHVVWWVTVVLYFGSIPLYGYSLLEIFHNSRNFWKQHISVVAIILVDLLMLISTASILVVFRYRPEWNSEALCKGMTYVVNVTAFFTNWSWVVLWTQRFLKVMYPFNGSALTPAGQTKLIAALFFLACAAESWTLILITENEKIDANMRSNMCDFLGGYPGLKWISLVERIFSLFIPFLLVCAADISILWRAYRKSYFQVLVRANHGKQSNLEHVQDRSRLRIEPYVRKKSRAKIISEELLSGQRKKKIKSISRCILAATVDLICNFPECIMDIMEKFLPMENLLGHKLHYSLKAASFILYALQYPFIIWYTRLLIKSYSPPPPSLRPKLSAKMSYSALLQQDPPTQNGVQVEDMQICTSSV